MENDPKHEKIRNLGFYLPKVFVFYHLKNEYLTPVLFTIILLSSLVIEFLPYTPNRADLLYYFLCFVSFFIIHISFILFLSVYLKEQKGEDSSLKKCIGSLGNCVLKMTGLTVLYFIIILIIFWVISNTFMMVWIIKNTMLLILLILLLILYLMFMFSTCYILDKGEGIIKSFKSSKDITHGYKLDIFRIMNPILALLIFIWMIAALSENSMLFLFLLNFTGIIAVLMMQRLIALIYIDLEYGQDNS